MIVGAGFKPAHIIYPHYFPALFSRIIFPHYFPSLFSRIIYPHYMT